MRVFIIGVVSYVLVALFPLPAGAQWIASGTPVCTSTYYQNYQRLSADGMGGALISWEDARNGNMDIYAQRIDGDGWLVWEAAGVCVCGATDDQYRPRCAMDGAGGGYIAWTDPRDGEDEAYLQRIREDGTVAWAQDGILLCVAPGERYHPVPVPDDAGGVIVVWKDLRDGYTDFYAQRVDSSGALLWGTEGVRIGASYSLDPYPFLGGAAVAEDGCGGAVAVWSDGRYGSTGYVFAQRVSGAGEVRWAEGGLKLTTNMTDRDEHINGVASDGEGGAVFTWCIEGEELSSREDILAQHVRADGTIAWDSAGAPVCMSPDWWATESSPVVIDMNNIFVVWMDVRPGASGVYCQKLDSLGAPQWMENGIPLYASPESQGNPRIVDDGAGGVVVSWFESRLSRTANDIYAQRVDTSGDFLWAPEGVNVFHADEGSIGIMWMVSDGAGGGIVSWPHNYDCEPGRIFAKRVTASGLVPVPTLLQAHEASVSAREVRLEWTVSAIGGGEFVVLRKGDDAGEYLELSHLSCDEDVRSYAYVDHGIEPGTAYVYRVAYEESAAERRVLFETAPLRIPAAPLALHQNRPNPFNPSTTIAFDLPVRAEARLAIYDAAGRLVRRLAAGELSPGRHELRWDGLDDAGRPAASGVYFCRLRAGKETRSIRLVLLR